MLHVVKTLSFDASSDLFSRLAFFNASLDAIDHYGLSFYPQGLIGVPVPLSYFGGQIKLGLAGVQLWGSIRGPPPPVSATYLVDQFSRKALGRESLLP